MRVRRILVKFVINHFLCATRFFSLKRSLLNWAGISIGFNSKIVGPIYFGNVISISIGNDSWIGKDISFDGNGMVSIGNNVHIAPHVAIETGGHEIGTENCRAGKGLLNSISIGNGTWIGARTTIINNTNIGKGCVVAAGALVNRSVDDNRLVAGVPITVKRVL